MPVPSLTPGDFSDLSGLLGGGEGGASLGGGSRGRTAAGDLDGLGGLVDSFRCGGFGDVIDSWIGVGTNRPITPDHLAGVIGADTVGALERETGMERRALIAQLAQVVPDVMDAVTPATGSGAEGMSRSRALNP